MVLSLIKHLLQKGEDVHALGQRDSYFTAEAIRLGASVHEAEFWRGRFDRASAKEVVATIRGVAPELAHFHGGRVAFHAMKSITSHEYSSIYTVHGFHFYQKNALLRKLAILAEARICRIVNHVVFVCEDDRRLAKQLGILPPQKPSSVIYNGFDPTGLPEPVQHDPRKVSYLGRLNPQKDPLLMVQIAGFLARLGLKTTLIGGGEMEPEVAHRVKEMHLEDFVRVTGTLPREQALLELADSFAFVLPSKWEGFPISILEAMALGVPVVASAVNGVPEAIVDGETGLLIRSRSAEDFAAGVQRLVESETLRESIVAAARQEVMEKFSLARCMAEHDRLYAGLAG